MNFDELFQSSISRVDNFDQILDFISSLSRGRIWLIGGMVYRGIAAEAYGTDCPEVDYDFIVEDVSKQAVLNTKHQLNTFGNWKVNYSGVNIDLIPLNNIDYINKYKLKPNIENYLRSTPLTIQSIAYAVKANKIIGGIGMKAIANKTVSVNNIAQAKRYEEIYNNSIEAYIKSKADSLGFTIL